MSHIDYGEAIALVNNVALFVFLFLLGGLVGVLGRRMMLYRRAGWPLPLLLRRNLVFFGGLGFLVLESVILRAAGGNIFTGETLLRLLFVLHYDVIAALLFAYYLKVEALDVGDPHDEDQ